jgi:hypothetical protein
VTFFPPTDLTTNDFETTNYFMPSLTLQAQLRAALTEAERILDDASNPFEPLATCSSLQANTTKPCAARRLFDKSASKDEVMQYCFLHEVEVRSLQCYCAAFLTNVLNSISSDGSDVLAIYAIHLYYL